MAFLFSRKACVPSFLSSDPNKTACASFSIISDVSISELKPRLITTLANLTANGPFAKILSAFNLTSFHSSSIGTAFDTNPTSSAVHQDHILQYLLRGGQTLQH